MPGDGAPVRVLVAAIPEGREELSAAERAARAMLDTGALDRVDRYRGAALRARHAVAAAAVRVAVADVLGADPRDVRLGATGTGQPYVPGTTVSISVSHAFPWVAAAVADRPVGVDVESIARVAEVDLVRARVLHDDERGSLGTSGDVGAFLWTAKEAVLKATGLGLRLPPAAVSARVETGPTRVTAAVLTAGGEHDGTYAVTTRLLPGGYAAAVAARAAGLIVTPLRPDMGELATRYDW